MAHRLRQLTCLRPVVPRLRSVARTAPADPRKPFSACPLLPMCSDGPRPAEPDQRRPGGLLQLHPLPGKRAGWLALRTLLSALLTAMPRNAERAPCLLSAEHCVRSMRPCVHPLGLQAKKIVGEVQRLAMGVGSPFESSSEMGELDGGGVQRQRHVVCWRACSNQTALRSLTRVELAAAATQPPAHILVPGQARNTDTCPTSLP